MKILRKSLLMVGMIIGSLFFVISCSGGDAAQEPNSTSQSSSGRAQQASSTSDERFELYDIDQNLRKWSEFAGKPVVINFWATWCGPCLRELPSLKRLYSEYHDEGVEIIGISVDQQNTIRNVVPYVQQRDIPWVIVYADAKAVREFRLGQSIPMTVFINANGVETGRITGAQPESIFEAEFKKMME